MRDIVGESNVAYVYICTQIITVQRLFKELQVAEYQASERHIPESP
jgi:hypothetical protein